MTSSFRSKVELAVGRRAVRVPEAWLQRFGARLHVERDGNVLDPRVLFAVRLIERASPGGLHRFGVAGGREQMRRLPQLMDPEPPKVRKVDETEMDGPRGPVPLRIYWPPGVHDPAPVLVYFHGGGGVVGDLGTHDVPARTLCREADCVVVSVAYGLAPEDPFPAGLEDCIAAFRWVRDHAEDFGGDGRVAVGGDSMGGNLAAVVAQQTRDDAAGGPCFQLLIYPMTDVSSETQSRAAFSDGFLLSDDTIQWFRRTYLRDAARDDPRVSPMLAADLAGLAPAFVGTAGFDPLRDDGEAYAQKLEAAQVPVTYRCFGDQVHGMLHMTGACPSSKAALDEIAVALAAGFAAAAD